MADTIVGVYTHFNEAKSAREELIRAGFTDDAVHLEARNDEAGTMKGNFTVGNGEDLDARTSQSDAINDVSSYQKDFAVPEDERQGSYVLTVVTASEEEKAVANRITRGKQAH